LTKYNYIIAKEFDFSICFQKLIKIVAIPRNQMLGAGGDIVTNETIITRRIEAKRSVDSSDI
jgi:hypothetical protein